jgi:hypothetical protein
MEKQMIMIRNWFWSITKLNLRGFCKKRMREREPLKELMQKETKTESKRTTKGDTYRTGRRSINVASACYHANKDSKNEKAVCKECGKTYTHQNQKRHEKSKFHQTNKQI